jgi:hypothetical protein
VEEKKKSESEFLSYKLMLNSGKIFRALRDKKKTLNQIFFFPPPKSEYFFQQHWESEYFFRNKP